MDCSLPYYTVSLLKLVVIINSCCSGNHVHFLSPQTQNKLIKERADVRQFIVSGF